MKSWHLNVLKNIFIIIYIIFILIDTILRKYGNCLANGGKDFNQGRERDIFLQLLPGQIYDLDDQCKLTYGPESFETGVRKITTSKADLMHI